MRRVIAGCQTEVPVELELGCGRVALFSTAARGEGALNQDAIGVFEIDADAAVFAVADGLGGGPQGSEAASLAIEGVGRAVDGLVAGADRRSALRSAILDAFEVANEAVRQTLPGAGTTLVVVELDGGIARAYHAGDSGALIVGGRGRIRLETSPHSPTGHAVAAGVLERADVHAHAERHLLSNCLGSEDMRIEVGAPVALAPRDTLCLASDGVLDNVRHETLVELVRKGPIEAAASALHAEAKRTMDGEGEVPGYPDDASALLFRPGASPRRVGGRAGGRT